MTQPEQTHQRLRLYHYWRSTSSWRVRMAFAIKGIEAELVHVHLLQGESESPEHLARNPMGYVPVLELLDTAPGQPCFLGESLAIMEWAEETYPEAKLLPGTPAERARIRQLAELINAGIQPLINLGVAQRHSADPIAQKAWNQDWIHKGLQAYEKLVSQTAGHYSFGNKLTLADICLIPQCYSAERNEVSLADYPTIARIHSEISRLPIFEKLIPTALSQPGCKLYSDLGARHSASE